MPYLMKTTKEGDKTRAIPNDFYITTTDIISFLFMLNSGPGSFSSVFLPSTNPSPWQPSASSSTPSSTGRYGSG